MKKILNGFRWFVAVLFVLFAYIGFGDNIISGLCFLLGAFLVSPLLSSFSDKFRIRLKKRFLIPAIFIFFLIGCFAFGGESTKETQEDKSKPSVIQEEAGNSNDNESPLNSVAEDENELVISDSSDANEDVLQDDVEGKSELEMHFIDVGQGDCTLIVCDGETMLIDAGNNTKGTAVQYYLTKKGIDYLNYVVCTHPDADHIGGMDVIITKFECEKIYMTGVSSDTDTYNELMSAMEYKKYNYIVPEFGDEFYIGSARCTVLGPINYDDDSNECSIVLRIEHGDNSFLISGDAGYTEENDILEKDLILKSDVYHVGHHGSNTSTSDSWLKAISPEFAIISCGKDNSYGHPHVGVLEKLKNNNVEVYRTDEQGSVKLVSDGKDIVWNCTPSDTWNPGIKEEPREENAEREKTDILEEPTEEKTEITCEEQEDIMVGTDITYVLNTNTKKFHCLSCGSVEDIKDKNRMDVTWKREEVIAQGYEPCKRCNP